MRFDPQKGRMDWESAEELHLLYDSLAEGLIIVHSDSHRFLFVNRRMSKVLGYLEEEILSKFLQDFIVPEALPQHLEDFERLKGRKLLSLKDIPMRRKDDTVIYLDGIGMPFQTYFKGEPCEMVFFQDVSAEKAVDKIVKEHEATLQSIFRASPVGMGLVTNRIFGWVNEKVEQITGYPAEELSGKSARKLYPDEEEFQRVGNKKYALLIKHGTGTIESRWLRKDGNIIDVLLSSSPLEPGKLAKGVTFTVMDITDRKEAEKEREALIRRLEKQKSELERFIYTLSHDLKSPLITMKGFLGFLDEDIAGGNTVQVQEDIKRISNAVNKMDQLVREILELLRIGHQVNPSESVAFGDLVEEALDLVQGETIRSGVKICMAESLPEVEVDRRRVVEVLQNLIENAIKNMGDQGHPQIEVGVRSQGEQTVFMVKDNGCGIEPRYHKRIFALFEKLNQDTSGSGVGLALVKRTVEVQGGRVWVESQGLGHGSTFCFTLPQKVLHSLERREEIDARPH